MMRYLAFVGGGAGPPPAGVPFFTPIQHAPDWRRRREIYAEKSKGIPNTLRRPPAGAFDLLDEISATAFPFLDGGPICISRDGSTVFAVGVDTTIGIWVWRWNGANWPNLQIIRIGTSGDYTVGDAVLTNVCANYDGTRMFLGMRKANTNDGVVYAFKETSLNTWTQMQRITHATADAQFGYSVDADNAGVRIVVGQPFVTHGDGSTGQGLVYFESGGTFTLEKTMVDDSTAAGGLGTSALISGDGATVVLGNGPVVIPSFFGLGTFESWTRSGTTWTFEERKYPSDDDVTFSRAGDIPMAISENGNKLITTDWLGINDLTMYYTRSGGAWTYVSTTSGFGCTGGIADLTNYGPMQISADGSRAVYGDFLYNNGGTDRGRIEVWDAAWTLKENIDSDDPQENQQHGRGVDISGDGFIVVWTRGPRITSTGSDDGDRVYAKVY